MNASRFFIPDDWRVLVLEDTEERIVWFRHYLPDATYCKTADKAIAALKEESFNAIFLDHDLHWMHVDNSIFKGTGKEVARFLAESKYPGIIVIHSRNEEGAASMKKFLPHARLAPFGEFEIVRTQSAKP